MATVDSELGTKLSSVLRGSVVTPESPEYDEARALYNAMINRRPALIAYPIDASDVARAITFGRESTLIRMPALHGSSAAPFSEGWIPRPTSMDSPRRSGSSRPRVSEA
jgi:hypothetical protein